MMTDKLVLGIDNAKVRDAGIDWQDTVRKVNLVKDAVKCDGFVRISTVDGFRGFSQHVSAGAEFSLGVRRLDICDSVMWHVEVWSRRFTEFEDAFFDSFDDAVEYLRKVRAGFDTV